MTRAVYAVAVVVLSAFFRPAGVDAVRYEWPSWGADEGGQRYSPLAAIHRGNVRRLQHAWTYRTGEWSDGTRYPTRSSFECTPIVADGNMFLVTPFGRAVALYPETSEELWSFDPGLDRMARKNLWAHRGLALWRSGDDRRILYGTLEGDLWALDARTGKPIATFGEGGRVRHGSLGMPKDPPEQWMKNIASPPAIYRDL